MAIFDIDKDELLRLSDTQLEELIARLAEAEIAAHGHSPAWVNWSGSINAPDDGIDIHVKVPVDTLSTGFLERPDTILQAKKHSMPMSEITKEMVSKRGLSPTIAGQAVKGGSYIIVSLGDDCSPPMKNSRLKAMRDAVKDNPCSDNIHFDFYDRSKLTQWLRQHPSIMLWVKGKIGQGYSGWQPYGPWSHPPQGNVDNLISAPGVTVSLPRGKGQKLHIKDAIDPMRELIRTTRKAVRITGLSGVGKTRIVQALFDETVGTDALDRTIAVYVDTGDEPEPSATAMMDRLIAEDRCAIMILDNCPSELHSYLANKVSVASSKVSLITIEYDIRDDKPQVTEVIHIEADGPEMAEQLLLRRFPGIGQNNSRQIAEFAHGNARISLAIAERVEDGESLAQLSDNQLFNRLFEQRNHPDDDLRAQAEILSLVYSFSVSNTEGVPGELEVLGILSGHSQNQLYRSAQKLLERHVAQKRANWRAILPHAIANKLAASALNSIPVEEFRATFEATGRQRLLMSFAHRLGLLHDHPVAKEIVEAWLQPDGLLGHILSLDDASARMLEYIGPVAPEALLVRIEAELISPSFRGMALRYHLGRAIILNLLQSLAFEPGYFERCIRLLILVADNEAENKNYDPVRNKITRFFQAFLSGTHASLGQRIAIMNECLLSGVNRRRELGFSMLSTALEGPHWTGEGVSEFGARPRDFGFQPNDSELAEWRRSFIDVAVRLGTSGITELETPARQILANQFRGMWYQEAIRDKLFDSARKIHAHHPWGDGWKAVRSMIYFDYTRRHDKDVLEPLPDNLAALSRELEPCDLVPLIMTYVLSKGHDYWSLVDGFECDDTDKYREAEKLLEAKALHLGQNFSASRHSLDELGPNLFSLDWMPFRVAFGKGLAKGNHDLRAGWQQLIQCLEKQADDNKDFAVFRGFIEQVDVVDPVFAQELLKQCSQHLELRHVLVGLHPGREFTEKDLDRCMALLDEPETRPFMFGPILWREQYAKLPEDRILNLARQLLSKPNGDDVVLEALSMRLHSKDKTLDILGCDLRRVGLKSAISRLNRDESDPGGSRDYSMKLVVEAALSFKDNEAEKQEWLDTIFSTVDKRYGYISSYEQTIGMTAALMAEPFLNRVFEGTEEQQKRRLHFIRRGGLRQSPLAKINIAILIGWCKSKNDPAVWSNVAAGISIWAKNGEENIVTLKDSAVALLESSHEPKSVLESFAESILLSSTTGDRTSVMLGRANAIGRLTQHDRQDISEAARAVYANLTELIGRERINEHLRDEVREQRFE